MSKLIDRTGKRYGRLTVIRRAKNAENGVSVWECACDCGKRTFVRGGNLQTGAVQSCGCLKYDSKPTLTHGMSKTRIYATWNSMKERCLNPNNKRYKDYGGRGIKVCDEWMNSPEAFIEWAHENGYDDSMTIERINVNGDYCPDNCTWIPFPKQAENRRSCREITYNGKTQNLKQWCDELGLPYMPTHNRIYKLKWSFKRAISEPCHVEKRNKKGR